MIGHEKPTWKQFSDAFTARFGELDTKLVFDKFKRLQQNSSVEDYYDEFEKIKGQVLKKLPGLTFEYYLENFVGGLPNDIKGMIRLLEPTSLEQALRLARYYESTLSNQPKKNSFNESYQKSGYSASQINKGVS